MKRLFAAIAICCASLACQAEDAFDVLEYRVEGNSVLPVLAIEQAVYPHLGEHKGLTAVEAARTALERAYHDAGYLTVFVDIPEQNVEGGVVRLRATEGRVERLRVVDANYYSLGEIKRRAPQLAEGAVPHFPTVQKELAGVNRSADRRVTPVLRPGRTPGTVEVDLKVEDRLPLHGDVELNNKQALNTTETRLAGSVRYDNLWQKEHGLSLAYVIAPEHPDDAKVLAATYILPAAEGRVWALYGVVSRSDVAQAGDLRVLGDTNILGLRLIQPLPTRGGRYIHSLSLGADYKNIKEDVLLGSNSSTSPISYLPFAANYSLTLPDTDEQTQLNVGTVFSIRGLADDTIECAPGIYLNEFDCKRGGASANFITLTLAATHTRKLGGSYALKARMNAQFAGQPLISNEQMSAGGADSVRGYYESAAFGDRGVAGGVELVGPDWGANVGRAGLSARPLLFADGAQLWVIDPAAGQTGAFTLSSVGVGLRLAERHGFSSSLDVAWPLKALEPTDKYEPRLHAKLAYKW
jgi:hemolysin activation/secretion protein